MPSVLSIDLGLGDACGGTIDLTASSFLDVGLFCKLLIRDGCPE